MQTYLSEEPQLIHVEEVYTTSRTSCPCPLIRSNVFGILPSHQIRLDCDGSIFNRYTLVKHFESYHRMLPECALRLRDAIFHSQSTIQTEIFSENEIIRVNISFSSPEKKTNLLYIFRTKNILSIVH